VPVVSVALAIARIGCFLHGCCSGLVASCPWCLSYPPRTAPYQLQVIGHVIEPGTPSSLPVHPLQLYFAGLALGIAALAVWWMRRPHRDGDVTLGCTLVFGLGSAALERLRTDHPARVFWVGVPALEWLAIALAIGATIGLWWRRASQPTGFIGG
jgi:phosphatidylglycerol:prolipoprotein diacylglycerol transferase